MFIFKFSKVPFYKMNVIAWEGGENSPWPEEKEAEENRHSQK